jgi:subtilisin family serine protease
MNKKIVNKVLLLLFLIIINYPLEIYSQNFKQGEIIIKLRNLKEGFKARKVDGNIITDISSIDVLNKKYSVYEMEKVFPDVVKPTTQVYSTIKGKIVDVPDLFPIFKIKFPTQFNPINVANEYKLDPNVEWATPNKIYVLRKIPNDPRFNEQWGLHNTGQTIRGVAGIPDADIDAPEAWDRRTGSSNVIIAVIDTGVDWNHPDLSANIWINPNEWIDNFDNDFNGYKDDIRGWDFSDNDNDPMDDNGHGTHVAGIASAVGNNWTGVSGVCWNCKIMPLKIFPNAYGDVILKAFRYAADKGVKVINNSWGNDRWDCTTDPQVEEGINYAYLMGSVVIFAAGNENWDNPLCGTWPASLEKVIAVGATDNRDQRWVSSNFGYWLDVVAPGENIYSTIPNNNYRHASGTSMAAPFVSGLAGLLISANEFGSVKMTDLNIRGIIEDTCDDF